MDGRGGGSLVWVENTVHISFTGGFWKRHRGTRGPQEVSSGNNVTAVQCSLVLLCALEKAPFGKVAVYNNLVILIFCAIRGSLDLSLCR